MKENTIIDYTRVHPRTLLWWAQRETCRDCNKLDTRADTWQCTAGGHFAKRRGFRSCVSTRDIGGACGPDALLFEQKATAA